MPRCQLCGRGLKVLGNHLRRIHGISSEQYKSFVPGSTVDEETSKKMSANSSAICKRRWQDPSSRSKMVAELTERARSRGRGVEYNGGTYRSKVEVRFVKWLDKNDIAFQYEPHSIPYFYGGKERRYIPDFFLPELGFYVEVKFSSEQEDEPRMQAKLAALVAIAPVAVFTDAEIP